MYKVFVNDKPIILTDSSQNESCYALFDFDNIAVTEILQEIKKNSVEGIILFCKDLDESWQTLKNHFTMICASGGLVLNDKKEFLLIYRNDKWDLPKGHIEVGETSEVTAVREVQEECGLSEIELNEFLLTTYHIFYREKEVILKKTDWFLMHTTFKGKLTPQTEEGISEAVFKNEIRVKKALQNTYANIKLVFDAFYQ